MTASLEGRVALVTGAGRGAGAAIARAFARAGARLVIADSGTGDDGTGADPTIARNLVAEIPDRAVAFVESLASPSAARAAIDCALAAYGALDIVVHAAAIRRPVRLGQGEAGAFDAVLRNNLSAAHYLFDAALPALAERAKARANAARLMAVLASAEKLAPEERIAMNVARAGALEIVAGAARALEGRGGTANAISLSAEAADLTRKTAAKLALRLAGEAGASIVGRHFAVAGDKVFVFGEAELRAWEAE